MGPLALKMYNIADPELRQCLESAQHFLIEDPGFLQVAIETNLAVPEGEEVFELRLPAPIVVVEMVDIAFLLIDLGESVRAYFMSRSDVGMFCIEAVKRSDKYVCLCNADPKYLNACAARLFNIDTMISLINEPRLVRRVLPSRPERRRAERVLGKGMSPAAWHKLSWTIGEASKPKSGEGDGSWRLPLHFSRAHWRRAKKTDPSSEKRRGHSGWWTWVSWSWKGHPDFGIKLHHYTPKIDPDGKSLATIMAAKRAVSSWQDQCGRTVH